MATYLQLYADQNQVQIQQLALLNTQLQQQRRVAEVQANLAQALFETERVARRVRATLRHDVFAAAVIAGEWGRRIQGLHAGLFHDVAAKHAWSTACAVLDGADRAARNDERVAADVDRYLNRRERHDALVCTLLQLGGRPEDPRPLLVEAERRFAQCHADAAGYGVAIAGVVALIGVTTHWAIAVLGMVAVVGCGAWWTAALDQRGTRRRHLAAVRCVVEDLVAFQESPDGMRWLEEAWSRHPLLHVEPAGEEPTAPHSGTTSQTYVERKLVERQVVVVRCRFCQQLAPVDLPTCSHCGAPGFGSSHELRSAR